MTEFPFPPARPVPSLMPLVITMILVPITGIVLLILRTKRPARSYDIIGWVCFYIASILVFERAELRPSLTGYRELFGLSAVFISMLAICLTHLRTREPQASLRTAVIVSLLFYAPGLTFIFGSALFIPYSGGHQAEANARSRCRRNLNILAAALWNDEADRGRFVPPVIKTDGEPDRSWRVDLLPELDERSLLMDYHKELAWSAPENQSLFMPRIYRCPSMWSPHPETPEKITAYAMVTGPDTFGGDPQGRLKGDITDGTSSTLSIVEACGLQIHWLQPRDVDITREKPGINLPGHQPNTSPAALSSYHHGVAHAAFADGSIRQLSANTNPQVLKAFMTVNGGEPVPEY